MKKLLLCIFGLGAALLFVNCGCPAGQIKDPTLGTCCDPAKSITCGID